MHTYIYIDVHIHTHIHTYIHTYMHTYIDVHINTYTYIHTFSMYPLLPTMHTLSTLLKSVPIITHKCVYN
jgi:hypothetical protein